MDSDKWPANGLSLCQSGRKPHPLFFLVAAWGPPLLLPVVQYLEFKVLMHHPLNQQTQHSKIWNHLKNN